MLAKLVSTCIVSGALVALSAALSLPSAAQEIVHALTGTVSAIDAHSGAITVLQDDHSTAVFPRADDKKASSAIDKRIATEITPADAFNKSGAYSIIFYYGDGDSREVVALKTLGKGPFSSTEGTVEKYDRLKSIAVKDSSGAVHVFTIDPATVAETNFGAVPAKKFSADKGDHVRIVSSTATGTDTALFVRDL